MTTAGVIFFWAAIVCLFCAVALGIAGRSCAPYRASSDTARLVDGKIIETPPVETRGCR